MSLQAASTSSTADRRFYVFTAVASVLALGLLAYLLLIRKGDPTATVNLRFMPAVNAGLNTLAATLLTAGWFAIHRGNRSLHTRLMISAFAASSLFLVGYLAYHYVHGDTRYQGAFRTAYLALLASHVLLSMAVVPMALLAFYFAWRKAFERHRKVAGVLLPIWLYVSVTGVVIFFMLRGSVPAA
jgi:putative membrane protein